MKMTLIEDLTYGGRALKAGETFNTTSDTDAHILRSVGKARDANEAETETQEEEVSTSPKRYNRRDLRARK
jgi:hypothetical protein